MTAPQTLLATPLTAAHRTSGARMVPFAGYEMPVQYAEGVLAEHRWTRAHAGLFDVSHMGPAWLRPIDPPDDAEAAHQAISAAIEPLVCGDIAGLAPSQLRYTLLLNETGGALDDLMVGRPAAPADQGSLYLVVNAGTKAADSARIAAAVQGVARLERADHDALIALQGPEAAAVMQGLCPGACALSFMRFGSFEADGQPLLISRSGYTGEDGFEILAPRAYAGTLWAKLVADQRVKPVGLGARDSLRLEAGLPLYGHDLDETTSPVEAGLAFAVSRRRRTRGDYPGAARIARELAEGAARVRIALLVEGAPAREGAEIVHDGQVVGRVTSGGFSPTLSQPIAIGFAPPALAAPGTRLSVVVRGRAQPAEAIALPFVPHRYARNP